MRGAQKKSSLSIISEERASIKIRFNQTEKRRIERHERLIEMIRQYSLTKQQQEKLSRLKKNTAMEIDLRFRNSISNKFYSFPKSMPQEQDEEITDVPKNFYYDLHSQNYATGESAQLEPLEIGRRVRSLDQVAGGIRSEKLIRKKGRLQTDLDNDHINYNMPLNLKRSKTTAKESPGNQIVLPILGKKIESLKTETNHDSKHKIERMLMKKLVTEAYQAEVSPIKSYEARPFYKRK